MLGYRISRHYILTLVIKDATNVSTFIDDGTSETTKEILRLEVLITCISMYCKRKVTK